MRSERGGVGATRLPHVPSLVCFQLSHWAGGKPPPPVVNPSLRQVLPRCVRSDVGKSELLQMHEKGDQGQKTCHPNVQGLGPVQLLENVLYRFNSSLEQLTFRRARVRACSTSGSHLCQTGGAVAFSLQEEPPVAGTAEPGS